jgi:hypothetical protein
MSGRQIGLRLPDVTWVKVKELADASLELPSETIRRLLREYFESIPPVEQATRVEDSTPPSEIVVRQKPARHRRSYRERYLDVEEDNNQRYNCPVRDCAHSYANQQSLRRHLQSYHDWPI